MSYKFAHFADIHWRGLSRHDEYRRSFEHAFSTMRKENVDAIFIVGDIVHSKTQGISPELIDSLCWWFKSMADIAPTYVTLGNHDGLIMNKDREDAISPIIRALNLPNLHLSKYSESIDINDDVEIVNYSCFDEEGWKNLKPNSDKISIALYHGAVKGSKTDIDWELDGEVDISIFDKHDFVFLGDIHKYQYLDNENRVAYCGSTIQQNYGESPGKGFMIWDIESRDKYSSAHFEVKHDQGFFTIDWQGSVQSTMDIADQFPDGSRFRVRTQIPMSQGEIKQLYSSLKEFKSATEIVMKHDVPKRDRLVESIEGGSSLNINDPNVVSSMIKKYYEPAGLSDRVSDKLDTLVHKFWKFANKKDRNPGIRWDLKKIEFDNTFGYGKDNTINFDSLEGITGIFGQNRIGKSSICGTIMYTLFNTTDRGTISNLHIINSRKGHCKSRAIISKAGKNYLVERQSVKKQNRAGKVSATTQLNLFEVDESENIVLDLAGEQRRDTEKVIREIVGSPEDFLLTCMSSQGEMSTFLKQKASSRKTVLSKFLELDIFERLYNAAREECLGLKQLLKSVPNRDYDIALLDLKNRLEAKLSEREETFSELEEIRQKSRALELTLATRSDNNLVTVQDVSEQQERVSTAKVRLSTCEKMVQSNEVEFEDLENKTNKIVALKEGFPVRELKEKLENQSELENQLVEFKHCIDKEKQKVKSLNKEVVKLEEVPCGDLYPTCKYIVSAHRAKKEVLKRNSEIDSLKEDLRANRRVLKNLLSMELREKMEKFNDVVSKLSDLTIDKTKSELKLHENKTKLGKASNELKIQESKLDEMKANVSTDVAAEQLRSLREKLSLLKKQVSSVEEKYSGLSESIGLLQSNIEKTKTQKSEFEKLNEDWRVFELFLDATSKNGIPLEVIRSRLPDINSEILSILQGVTGFTVELESDEGSNEMNVYINYGDSKRIIETCSGMEKMMASIAIRVALTNVSSLPKANILIIDEGFGALDSSNIEACSRFLESLKKWFQCILIISHVDAIKDTADNLVEVSRKGPDAHVSVV